MESHIARGYALKYVNMMMSHSNFFSLDLWRKLPAISLFMFTYIDVAHSTYKDMSCACELWNSLTLSGD